MTADVHMLKTPPPQLLVYPILSHRPLVEFMHHVVASSSNSIYAGLWPEGLGLAEAPDGGAPGCCPP